MKLLEQCAFAVRYNRGQRCASAEFLVQWRPKLRERLAHLIGLIMRRVACDASGALRGSFV